MKNLLLLLYFSSIIFTEVIAQESVSFTLEYSENVQADQLVMEISTIIGGNDIDSINNVIHEKNLNAISILKNFGYKKEDIYLLDSDIKKSMYDENNVFSASQSYRILLTNFDLFDTMRNNLIKNGADEVTIISFGSSKIEQQLKSVYNAAMKRAIERAQLLTNSKKIKIKSIHDNTDDPYSSNIKNKLTFDSKQGNDVMYCVSPDVIKKESTITNVLIPIKVSLRIELDIE